MYNILTEAQSMIKQQINTIKYIQFTLYIIYKIPECSCLLVVCKKGRYGPSCSSYCECDNGATCDSVTGKCVCTDGYIGERCNVTCPQGYYGNCVISLLNG